MNMIDIVAVAISGAPFPTAKSRSKARAATLNEVVVGEKP